MCIVMILVKLLVSKYVVYIYDALFVIFYCKYCVMVYSFVCSKH